MKIGIITKRTDVARAIWLQLPELVQWALLAKRGRPGDVELGDLQ